MAVVFGRMINFNFFMNTPFSLALYFFSGQQGVGMVNKSK